MPPTLKTFPYENIKVSKQSHRVSTIEAPETMKNESQNTSTFNNHLILTYPKTDWIDCNCNDA